MPLSWTTPANTWSHGVTRYDGEAGSFRVDRVRLIETGPVQAVIRIESSFGGSRLVEELILGAQARSLIVRSSPLISGTSRCGS